MALHLVTGYKGTAHITPEDVGAFNAGVIGSGEYVLNTGNKFAASVISNNTVKILDGDVVMQGRHITLKKDTFEEITINNGEVDKNRNDLIVIRYTKDSATGTEDVSMAVLQGTSTTGNATDPELTTGDVLSGDCLLHEMPLYRIRLTGLTVGEPEKLFKESGALKESMSFRGWNPISSPEEDTPEKWLELGTGFWMIDIADVLIGQPSRWGFLYSTVFMEEVAQEFVVQASGEKYHRSANKGGWYGNAYREGTWSMYHDSGSASPFKIDTYTGDGNGSQFIDVGFTPSAVIVTKSDGVMSHVNSAESSHYYYFGGLAIKGKDCSYWDGTSDNPIVSIVDGGFRVYNTSFRLPGGNYNAYIQTNIAATFNYIAFR